jgi:integrase
VEHLVQVDDQTYLYRLGRSKTDQTGTDHTVNADKPIVGPAAEALTACEPLSPQAVWLIVKRRVGLAGLEGDFGAHSLRSGFVTEAGRQNVPLGEAMALTGHRSVQTVMRYFQSGAVQHTKAATLLKDSAET